MKRMRNRIKLLIALTIVILIATLIIQIFWIVSAQVSGNTPSFISMLPKLILLYSPLFYLTWSLRKASNSIMNNEYYEAFKEKYPRLSVVRIMQRRKGLETIWNVIILFLALLTYILSSYYFKLTISYGLIVISFLVMLLLAIYNSSFDFRIGKGFYGNNEREAREIIMFILKESDNIDFTDNGKLKKIISDTDLDEFERVLKPSLNPEYQ